VLYESGRQNTEPRPELLTVWVCMRELAARGRCPASTSTSLACLTYFKLFASFHTSCIAAYIPHTRRIPELAAREVYEI
jgi:hypothetical protein